MRHLNGEAGVVGIEFDPAHCPDGALNMDFFAYPTSQRFGTIIGNPPYVRFQDISPGTRALFAAEHFDGRSNLYLFFIEMPASPRAGWRADLSSRRGTSSKATSAVKLNRLLWSQGSITDAIELGDARIFDALPNCLIWRFEKGATEAQHAPCGTGAGA